MADPEIRREETMAGERYVLTIEGHEAELTFTDLSDNRRLTDHTRVPQALGGRGVGKKLVARAVRDARSEQKIIVPQCWFVAQQIERNPDWQDVLG
jgi:predicted GNAT family acetyltransferase